MRASIILIGLGLLLGPTNVHAHPPFISCDANKVRETAKYYACRLHAESRAIRTGEAPDFSKCDSRYSKNWQRVEDKAGGECLTEGDEAVMLSKMVGDADTIVAIISGGLLVDNGDGTVTDHRTGLMWEKKTGTVGGLVACDFNPDSSGTFNPDPGGTCSDLHNVKNVYDWNEGMGEWSSRVNGIAPSVGSERPAGLGGHTDWRLPTIVKLQTLLIEPFHCDTVPCIDPIFGPTDFLHYWSSTSGPIFSNPPAAPTAMMVSFLNGFVLGSDKLEERHVRAVRGAP